MLKVEPRRSENTAAQAHDHDAEQAVLGAVLLDKKVVGPIADLAEKIYSAKHRLLFGAMLALSSRNVVIDPVTLQDELKQRGDLDTAGGMEYVAALIDVVPTAANVTFHAEIVRRRWLEREHARLGALLGDPSLEPEQFTAAIDELWRIRRAADDTPDAPTGLLRTLADLLNDPSALTAPEVVVPRFAWRGRVSLVIGREKWSGKSTLLTAAAAAVTRVGASFLGDPCASGPVLWVTADHEHANDLTARAVRFRAEPARLHILWPSDSLTELSAAVTRIEPVLVVIDTLHNFAHTEVEKATQSDDWPKVMLPLVKLARERNLAIAVAHHSKKAEGGGYRDSTAIAASVDFLLELHQDAGDRTRRNVAAIGRWPAPDFSIKLTGDAYHLIAGAELSLDARVLAFIDANQTASQQKVREHIGGRGMDTDAAVTRLIASGALRDIGNETRHKYVTANYREGGDALPL